MSGARQLPLFRRTLRECLRDAWRRHKHLHGKYTLAQALEDPILGRVLRRHAWVLRHYGGRHG